MKEEWEIETLKNDYRGNKLRLGRKYKIENRVKRRG